MKKNNIINELNQIGTEPYKGVRDFYPEDMFAQKYIFGVMKKTAESFGYSEYSASILEPTILYKAKSGEEIVNEQTYSFTDRGGREVTLRPEMTPTVARMVAGRKRELTFPLRWYSIPNIFRYERPQKGRLREHWQLNADIFGVKTMDADAEIIALAHALMKNFGAKDEHFKIKINNRKIINAITKDFLEMKEEEAGCLMKLIDKKAKSANGDFEAEISILLGDKSKKILDLLKSKTLGEFAAILPQKLAGADGIKEVEILLGKLREAEIKNVEFAPDLVRGFDYYTGIVFEIYDNHPQNNRALFGGGRYDDLLDIFGEEKVPAVGFGMGDVTIKDFLETYHLMPKYKSSTNLYLCTISPEYIIEANKIAKILREKELNAEVNLTDKKLAEQVKIADKKKIPFVVCIGENEIKGKRYKIKNMKTGEEVEVEEENLAEFVKNYADA